MDFVDIAINNDCWQEFLSNYSQNEMVNFSFYEKVNKEYEKCVWIKV